MLSASHVLVEASELVALAGAPIRPLFGRSKSSMDRYMNCRIAESSRQISGIMWW